MHEKPTVTPDLGDAYVEDPDADPPTWWDRLVEHTPLGAVSIILSLIALALLAYQRYVGPPPAPAVPLPDGAHHIRVGSRDFLMEVRGGEAVNFTPYPEQP